MSNTKLDVKKNLKWLILFLAIIILLPILEDIFFNEVLNIDTFAYNIVITNFRNDFLTPIMKIITKLGGATVLIVITLLSFLVIKNKKIGTYMSISLISCTILNYILKIIVQRPRPSGYMLIQETGYSFPSGHAMASTAFYGFLIYLINKNIKNKGLKIFYSLILSMLIISIGFSRIYLGVHYMSDVIAGFVISTIYLILFTTFIDNEECENQMKKFLNSFKYAFHGVWSAIQKEIHVIFHFVAMVLVIAFGFLFHINIYEWIACIILFGLVISSEMINTAIELTLDIVMPEKNEKVRKAKDIAAAAVLVNAIVAAIIGCIIFIPKIL